MFFAIIALDKPDTLQIRLDNRTAHLSYVDKTGVVEMAGPFLDGSGNMCGSLLIIAVSNMADAEKWADDDPYAKAGLFETVSVRKWKKVIG